MTSLFTVDEEAVTAASQSDGAASATASSVVDTNLKRTLSKMGTFETEEEEHKNRRKLVARRIKSFKKSGQNAVVGSQSKEVAELQHRVQELRVGNKQPELVAVCEERGIGLY